jgi:hypothetical protein
MKKTNKLETFQNSLRTGVISSLKGASGHTLMALEERDPRVALTRRGLTRSSGLSAALTSARVSLFVRDISSAARRG